MRTAAVLLWLCMAAWLVRFEAFPEYFTHSLSGYKGLLSRNLVAADSWMKISLQGTDIGYSHTDMDINDNNPSEHYVLNNRLHLAFDLAGTRKNIHALSSVYLDIDYKLQKFTFSMTSPITRANIEGGRTRGDTFNVSITLDNGQAQTLSVEIPDDVLIYAPICDTALKQLSPGQQLTIHTLDPVSLRKTSMIIHALRREQLTLANETIDTTVIETGAHGMTLSAWLDKDGNVVKQESSLGWSMQKCTPEAAYQAALSSPSAGDIMKVMLPLFISSEKTHD